jgi:hypothetical protein
MKRQWTNEELIADFTISAKELDLIGDSKTDHNLLGAACLLKYFQYEGRFPDQKPYLINTWGTYFCAHPLRKKWSHLLRGW